MLHLVVSLFVVLLGAAAACTASPSQTPTSSPLPGATESPGPTVSPSPTGTPVPLHTPVPTPDPVLFKNSVIWDDLYIAIPQYQVATSIERTYIPPGTVTNPYGGSYLWVQFAFFNRNPELRQMKPTLVAYYQADSINVVDYTEFYRAPFVGEPFLKPNSTPLPRRKLLSLGTAEFMIGLFALPRADLNHVRLELSFTEPGAMTFEFKLESGRGKVIP
jgi:hypothetical protein